MIKKYIVTVTRNMQKFIFSTFWANFTFLIMLGMSVYIFYHLLNSKYKKVICKVFFFVLKEMIVRLHGA